MNYNMLLHKLVQFKNQILNLGIYFFAALIPMCLSLISNPFIAKNMSPEDYAITGYYSGFTSLFGPLVSFYLLHYYTKRYYELDEKGRTILRATLFKALIYFSLFLAFIAIAALFIYTTFFNSESEIPFLPYAFMSFLSLPLTGIYMLDLADYRMSRQSRNFFALSVFNGITRVVLSLLFVVVLKLGAFGSMSGTLVSNFIIFAFVFFKNKDLIKINFDYSVFKKAVVFCWPLVIASMLTFFSTGYDKVFLERLGDLTALGIYSVGVSIAAYMNVFGSAINDTFQPDIFQNVVQRKYRTCLKYIAIKLMIMTACVAVFCLFAPYIISILTFGRYESSTIFAVIVSLSSITSMLYYSMSQVTVALGYTSITLVNKIIGSIISIISFNLLINYFGAIGAAWGVVLSYFYFFLGNVVLVLIKKKNKKQ